MVETETKAKRPALKFLFSLTVALGMAFISRQLKFTDLQLCAIFLLFFSIPLSITQAIPPYAVSRFIIACLVLDRFNLRGATHFLQSRISFTLR